MSSLHSWFSEHKLAGVGTLGASAIGASLAYTRKRAPFRLIPARTPARALTLAVLSGAALMYYYDASNSVLESDWDVSEVSFDPIADW